MDTTNVTVFSISRCLEVYNFRLCNSSDGNTGELISILIRIVRLIAHQSEEKFTIFCFESEEKTNKQTSQDVVTGTDAVSSHQKAR